MRNRSNFSGWGSKWAGIKRTYRCHWLDENGKPERTESGKVKRYRCDGLVTFCCCSTPSTFVWEKDTVHNGYDGFNGYVHPKHIYIVDEDWKKMPKEQQDSFIAGRGRA